MLKFLEIELIGFTGMILNNVHRFQLKFDSPYTLLLGRNGSGKSRLISMLNPLPPTKEDLIDGGMKRVRIQYNGEVYSIVTIYEKSLKSTITNETTGETLIEHANPTVHANAVKQLFGWTKEINDVITGQVLFTKMSVAERKKWFGLLSESDLTYALRFFKTAKDRVRDLEGVRRHLKRTVEELSPRVIEQAELLELAREAFNKTTLDIESINAVIRDTVAQKPRNNPRTTDLVEQEMLKVSDAILKSQYKYTEDDLSEQLHGISARIEDALAEQKRVGEEYVQLEDKAKSFEQFNPEALEAIKQDIADYNTKIDSLLSESVEWEMSEYDVFSLQSAQRLVSGIIAKLIEWLPDYRALLSESAPLDQLHAEYTDLLNKTQSDKRACKNRIADITDYLQRAENEGPVDCPSCKTSFKPGYTEHQVNQVKANLTATHNELTRVSAELEKATEGFHRITKLILIRDRISGASEVTHAHPVFKQLFSYYLGNSNEFNVEAKLRGFQHDLEVSYELAVYRDRLAKTTERYERGLAVLSGDALKLQVLKDNAMLQMDNLAQRLELLRSQHAGVRSNYDHLLRLEAQVKQLDHLGAEHADALYREYLNNKEAECIGYRDMLMGRLAESRNRLMRMDQEAKELARLTGELTEIEDSLVSTKSIVKAISPEEGVLSEYLHRSMVGITDLMTAYINSVWSYEMCIKPCDFSSGDLDYKFPFWVKDESNLTKDISRGSKAQQEIINFVFVLAVYRAMGFDGYPLLLDEISSGFDEEHRPTMVDYVKRLIDTEQHMQLVMVSHDATTHYRLTHADLCVLDPVGVTLPESYNENVIME